MTRNVSHVLAPDTRLSLVDAGVIEDRRSRGALSHGSLLMTGHLGAAIAGIVTPLRGWSEARALDRVPRGSFDSGALRPLDGGQVARMLQSAAAAQAYRTDGPEIDAALAGGEIDGGVNVGDRRALHALSHELAPRRVLEIGTHVGASTAHIARPLSRRGDTAMSTVDIADVNRPDGPWRRAGLARSPRDMLARLGCADVVRFEVGDSIEVMQRLDERYDLVFLDGRHTSDQVYREVELALRLLAPGGVLLLHDYYPGGRLLFPGTRPVLGPYLALERIMGECGDIAVVPLGDLPWPTKLGSNATSLALVARGIRT